MTVLGSVVVTGAAGGVGAVIAAHLAGEGYAVIDIDPASVERPGTAVRSVRGDAADPAVAREAAELAESLAPLRGWVNNAAVFHDAGFLTAGAAEISALIGANLDPAVVGTHTAVTHLVARGRGGSIVNISSHQAQRAVRGALPYATAKAAVEGMTRAAAVDHGPDGIRVNALALGSIATARSEEYRRQHPGVDAQLAQLHPLGRIGSPADVAAAVAFLLSPASAFISGVVLPVDGGRAAQGQDPESI